MSPRLSVVLVVRDEAEETRECLRTITWADEIVVLDTGSRDRTVEFARPLASTVASQEVWRGFGPARQEAERYAKGEWILMLDADERLSGELIEDVRRAVARDDRGRAYRCRVESWCFGRRVRFGGWSSFTVTRLYPRGHAAWNDALVHERLLVPRDMALTTLRGRLIHHTFRTRSECDAKFKRYAEDWATERIRSGERVRNAIPTWLRSAWTFVRGYFLRLGLLDGRVGLHLALATARYTHRKYRLLAVRKGAIAPRRSPEPSGGSPS